ncbi:hypothetical protein [Variovorax ginsengisoli]|uniref:ABC transporter permease n=1 Tax=Variovorax ginsengisoli TaxID=363844 RepID=A0ABT9SA23_9BURK|nr:hypothetical protein [Variovorax ginsengisoli]MDP9901055.1 hypothetical protein [Variovorax ginsengisoli]
MFYAFLVKRLPRWLALAVAALVYAALIVLMLVLANTDDAVFRYMR